MFADVLTDYGGCILSFPVAALIILGISSVISRNLLEILHSCNKFSHLIKSDVGK